MRLHMTLMIDCVSDDSIRSGLRSVFAALKHAVIAPGDHKWIRLGSYLIGTMSHASVVCTDTELQRLFSAQEETERVRFNDS